MKSRMQASNFVPEALIFDDNQYPGAEVRLIKGLTSKADVDDWLNGERRIAWLRSQGYAK
jgi:hypothetical protein